MNKNKKTHALILLNKETGLFCYSNVARQLNTEYESPLFQNGAILSRCYSSIRAFTSSNGKYKSHMGYDREPWDVCSCFRATANAFKAAKSNPSALQCDELQYALERTHIITPTYNKSKLTEYHLSSALHLIGGFIPTSPENIPFSPSYRVPSHIGEVEQIINIACQLMINKPEFIISSQKSALKLIKMFLQEYVLKAYSLLDFDSDKYKDECDVYLRGMSQISVLSCLTELLVNDELSEQKDIVLASSSPVINNAMVTTEAKELAIILPTTLSEWKIALKVSVSRILINASKLRLPSLDDLSDFFRSYADAINDFNGKSKARRS